MMGIKAHDSVSEVNFTHNFTHNEATALTYGISCVLLYTMDAVCLDACSVQGHVILLEM